MRSCMLSLVCSLEVGNESGRIQLAYAGDLLLAWGMIFDRNRDRDVVCIFSILTEG